MLVTKLQKILAINLISLLVAAISMHGSQLIVSGVSSTPASASFPFYTKPHTTSLNGSNFYIGALNNVSDEQAAPYTWSYVPRGSTRFIPLAPQQVNINGEAVANPLLGQALAFVNVVSTAGDFGIIADRPVAVPTAHPANVYAIQDFVRASMLNMAVVEGVKDALGATSAGIVALATSSINPAGIFAAVKKNGGNFGDFGSGIALISMSEQVVDKVRQFVLVQLNANPLLNTASPFAAPVSTMSPALAITSPLASLTNVVDMWYDPLLQRLYMVVQAQGASGASDGAYGILMGYVDPTGHLYVLPIAPSTIFTNGNQNEIVGAIAANTQVSLQSVRSLFTSTKLNYLVVLGGNGSPAATKRTVYALPIVDNRNAQGAVTTVATQGTLANKNSAPQTFFSSGSVPTFLRREVNVPAATPSDIFTTQTTGGGQPIPANYPAHVGFGPLAAGDIDEIMVAGDTVFAVVSTAADATQLPGIFYSQALFGSDGRIMTWTQWQRVAGTTTPSYGSGYDPQQANFMLLQGANAASVNTVLRTSWASGNANGLLPLVEVVNFQFPTVYGGVQGLFDFPENAPGLVNISALIATGLGKVLLAQTGQLNGGGAFMPNGGSGFKDNQQIFTDGTLTADGNAQTIVISGGVLQTIGPVVAATLARNGSSGPQGFLFVGGTNGLAVLSQANGQGWDATTGLTNNFSGLLNGMSFKLVGDYTFVRKLLYEGNFLYVLTDSKLDRLDLTVDGFPATTLATVNDFPGGPLPHASLLDLVVSGKFALISVKTGLFRVGNGADVTTATTAAQMKWTYVSIGQQAGPAIALLPISYTGLAQDVAHGPGGNIYVLNSYNFSGQVNRYAVSSVDGNPITENTLTMLPDILIEDIPDYYINFAGYSSIFATDGSVQFHGNNRDLTLAPYIQTGVVKSFFKNISLNLSGASNLVQILRSSASGSWLVAGDFGLQVNE